MENLNDVEFGSDKSGEEAPILVAQRYLNIFRQVHIFNKAKRDEFDDELLALPTNITDFFKRMPGGRLLVEHIEKVKTERGIAFVKANREDFDEGAGKTDTPSVASNGVVQAVAGNITIDASFADALAQALANAFKQLPQSPISTSGGASTITADFGNAFDIIAEEIRTSRASLLDVLKETRSITDSVIASQVSISRILEGILATRDRDDTDIADLNNRIIASQASITKLLEGLYTASNKKNAEISEYLNVEKRLQRFREEISSDLDISLQKMQELFRLCAQSLQDRKLVIETRSSEAPISVNSHIENAENFNIASTTNNTSTNTIKSGNISRDFSAEQKRLSGADTHETVIHSKDDEGAFVSETNNWQEDFEHKKKKKKQKKNRDTQFLNEAPQQVVGTATSVVSPSVSRAETPIVSVEESNSNDYSEDYHIRHEQVPSFDGVIRNKAFKHEDNFDNVRLDIPPLDTDNLDERNIINSSNSSMSSAQEKQSDLTISDNLQDFKSKQDSDEALLPQDDLDFILTDVNDEHSSVDDVPDFSDIQNPDYSNVADDGLDFALPDTSFSDSDETEDRLDSSMGFENISNPENNNTDEDDISTEFDDDLDFALPHTPSTAENIYPKSKTSEPLEHNQDMGVPHLDNVILPNDEKSSLSENIHQQTYASNSVVPNDDSGAISSFETTIEDNNISELNSVVSTNTYANEASETSVSIDSFMEDHTDQPSTSMTQSVPDAVSYSSANDISPLDAFMANSTENKDVTGTPLQDIGVQDNNTFVSESDAFMKNDDNISSDNNEKSFTADNNVNEPLLEAFIKSNVQNEDVTKQSAQSFEVQDNNTSISRLDELMEDNSNHSIDINENHSSVVDNDVSISPLDAFMADRNNVSSSDKPLDNTSIDSNVNIAGADDENLSIEEAKPNELNQTQSRYSSQLDKIREALTSDNIDISSLDQPIELDDYSDDENVGKDNYDDILSNAPTHSGVTNTNSSLDTSSHQGTSENDEDWEWEYVDEDGNPIPENGDDEDWEWEYVEDDDGNDANVDDNKK